MITTYATLQSEVAGWLNRTDLTAAIKTFVQLAEARFQRDPRVRKLQNAGTFTVSADDASLPSDLLAVESWYQDGPTDYRRIQIVGAEALPEIKTVVGTTGGPRYAAIIAGTARFAPAPDTSYATKLVYWRKIASLSDANPTNWLLLAHPDVYLYAALVESAPYLQDDPRLALWEAELEKRIAEVDAAAKIEQFPEQPQAEDQRWTKTRP